MALPFSRVVSPSLCQMFAVYVMCGAQEKDAVRLTLEQIDVVRRMCTEYQDFELVTSAQGIVHLQMGWQAVCLQNHCGDERGIVRLFVFYLVDYLQL